MLKGDYGYSNFKEYVYKVAHSALVKESKLLGKVKLEQLELRDIELNFENQIIKARLTLYEDGGIPIYVTWSFN